MPRTKPTQPSMLAKSTTLSTETVVRKSYRFPADFYRVVEDEVSGEGPNKVILSFKYIGTGRK